MEKGFSYTLSVRSKNYGWERTFMASSLTENIENQRHVPFDINLRIVHAFPEIGKGYNALSTFSTLIYMPPDIVKSNYGLLN